MAGAGPLAWAALALGLGAAVLMVLTEFSDIQTIRTGQSTCGASDPDIREICRTTGGEKHNYALVLIGLFAGLLAFGAAVGRSRPAALALLAVGVVVLLIALAGDLPSLDDKRGIDARYANVEAETGGGFYLELIAGGLAVLGAGMALLRERVEPRRERRRAEAEE